MSAIYLFRHGQAGTRLKYDTLSVLGRRQVALLGDFLASQGIRFTAVLAGTLERQQETAAAVCRAYAAAGAPFPDVETEPGWNEFDLDAVYREIAPVLADRDAAFRAEFEQMQADLKDENHAIHHEWSRCDIEVVRAWIAGSIPCGSETWAGFQGRIGRVWKSLNRFGAGENIAVFSSATPIGLCTGLALGVDARTQLRLAGALYNSAYVTLRLRDGDGTLFSFNNVPHLPDPALRTFR